MTRDLSAADLTFPVRGTAIPADHGFLLYAAISEHLPVLHGAADLGIHPIHGRLVGGRQLELTPRSQLVLRLPTTNVATAIGLAGRTLLLAGAPVSVGIPSLRPLKPAATLTSRLVVIRGFMEPFAFLAAVERQLAALAVQGIASLLIRATERSTQGQSSAPPGSPLRRTLRIHDKEIVGFAVRVSGLTAEESIRLQEAGVGGRRRFGCGIFVPEAW